MRPWRNQIHHGDCLELMSQMPAALSTRPLFVFVRSKALSGVRWQLLDESLTPRALAMKGISILLIVVGVGGVEFGLTPMGRIFGLGLVEEMPV